VVTASSRTRTQVHNAAAFCLLSSTALTLPALTLSSSVFPAGQVTALTATSPVGIQAHQTAASSAPVASTSSTGSPI
jgi:hypothetical protein